MEIPERPATPVPEPPKFSEPEISPPQFGGQSTPFNEMSPPPTSPYEVKRPSMNLQGEEADDPDSAVTMIQPLPESMPTPPPSPFQQASAPPPAASSPQKFEPPTTPAPIGSAASPVAPNAAAGQSKMLAWVSVILGVLGLTICCGAIIPSVIAIITGFIARSKAAKDPAHYGGIPLAMTGIVTGLLGVVIGVVWLIFLFFFNGLQALSRAY
jgi:hypothetical protein